MLTAAALKLNKEQAEAASRLWQSDTRALQIIAGAGSGKTTALTAAILSAIEAGYAPERIAALTFSRRAAHELRERLKGHAAAPGFCGTIHSLAWRLIREGGNPPRLIQNAQAKRAEIARGLFAHYAHVPEKILLREDFLSEDELRLLHAAYNAWLVSANRIDFDGMISRAAAEKSGDGRFDVVFVDEFQDTSPDQFEFIRSLNAKKYFVVGDDWQSIYRFRGADVALTRDFRKLVPESERLYLVNNYRSGGNIVKLGNGVIKRSKDFVPKRLKATNPAADRILCLHTRAENATAAWQKFRAALSENQAPSSLQQVMREKVAILVRTNAQRLLLERNKPENCEILTIHKSKGLEFDNVLVFGIAEHSMPHRDNDFDEEVRILYVALTRARKFLGFVAWENGDSRSVFLPYLMRNSRIVYF